MPDVADELRRVAGDAARDARPLPIAAVIALGDRRRRRRWSRSILAGAVAVGTVAAIAVVASARTSASLGGPQPAATPAGCTERVALTAVDGRISGCVSYQYGPRGLRVHSVAASFTASAGFDVPNFTFMFRDQTTGKVVYQFATAPVDADAVRSYSTGPILLGARPGMRAVHRGDVLQITLRYEANDGRVDEVATLSLSLNRHGLLCPGMDNDPESSNGVPIC